MTTTMQDESRRLLEEFVFANEELTQLETISRQFNIFEAVGSGRNELHHSNFLRFLLDPKESHGLGDKFLKELLQRALRRSSDNDMLPFTIIDLDSWDFLGTEILREWKNIDILLRDESLQVAVIIENKIGTEEHSDQLQRYFASVEGDHRGWKIIGVLLSPDGAGASDPRYISIDYGVVRDSVESVMRNHGLPDRVRFVLQDYSDLLRKHLMDDSDIKALCQQIYKKHRIALDLIIEHRPDQQGTIRELLEHLIQNDTKLSLDDSTKAYIRFVPKQLDIPALRVGKGWTKSKRILLFEFQNIPDNLALKLLVGPGEQKIRERLFDLAASNQPPFGVRAKKLTPSFCTLYSRSILTARNYEVEFRDIQSIIEAEWHSFIGSTLPELLKVLDREASMWPEIAK